MRVPAVSNMSTTNRDTIAATNDIQRVPSNISNLVNTAANRPKSGELMILSESQWGMSAVEELMSMAPMMIPTIHVSIIPPMTANHHFLCHMRRVTIRQNNPRRTPGSAMGPS